MLSVFSYAYCPFVYLQRNVYSSSQPTFQLASCILFFFILTVFNESCRQDYFITLFLHLLSCFFLMFALFLSYLARFGFRFKDLFAVFVQFQSGGNHLAGVNAHTDICSLLPLHSFSVDAVFLPVNLDCFASLLPLVVPSYTLNFIILSDGHGSNVVLLSQLFRKRRRYNFPANVGRRIEMPFLILASVRSYKGIELHFGHWCFSDGHKREEICRLSVIFLSIVLTPSLSSLFHANWQLDLEA